MKNETLHMKHGIKKGKFLYCRVGKGKVKMYDTKDMHSPKANTHIVHMVREYGYRVSKGTYMTPKSVRNMPYVFYVRNNPAHPNVKLDM